MRIIKRLISPGKKKAEAVEMPVSGRSVRNFIAQSKGSMSVEFGILAPIFLMLVFGIVDFGHAWYMKMEITSASREGAGYGTRYQTGAKNLRITPSALSPSVSDWVKTNYASLLPDDANLTVTPAGPGYTSGAAGDDLTVTVTAVKNWFVIGSLLPGLGNSVTMTATTAMKVE